MEIWIALFGIVGTLVGALVGPSLIESARFKRETRAKSDDRRRSTYEEILSLAGEVRARRIDADNAIQWNVVVARGTLTADASVLPQLKWLDHAVHAAISWRAIVELQEVNAELAEHGVEPKGSKVFGAVKYMRLDGDPEDPPAFEVDVSELVNAPIEESRSQREQAEKNLKIAMSKFVAATRTDLADD